MHLLTVLALVLGACALPSESNAADTAAELDLRAVGSSCKYSVSPVFLLHPSSQLDLTIPPERADRNMREPGQLLRLDV